MTVVDFTAFIDRLATASGETILPFFRTSLGIEDKKSKQGFDPVTEADRAALEVVQLRPYFRWLSRPPEASRLRHLPGTIRGAVEYTADRVLPLHPWMHLAVLRRKR